MHSPFEGGRNAEVFAKMLDLRFKEWARQRKNLLARRRYREKREEKAREERQKQYRHNLGYE